jgi:hypothetical protein
MADPIEISGATQILGGGAQSFVQRLITVQITLDSPTSPSQPLGFSSAAAGGVANANVVTLSGHRTSVRINMVGPANNAVITIFGLNQSLMNELSQLGIIYNQIRKNSIIVSAGDAISGMTPIYGGFIFFAYADYNQAPEVPMVFTCNGSLTEDIINRAPTTFSGVADVATLMSGWAALMNKGFENNGVTAKLANPYYGGNVWSMVQAAARDAGINAQLVDGGNTLSIWPLGKSRNLSAIPLISPTTGMIGYPAYAPGGWAIIRHLFNPAVKLGGLIQVQSSIPIANRTWVVYWLDYALDSLVPHGEWMGVAHCYPQGLPAPFPPAVSSQ